MTTHTLKICKKYADAVMSGAKTFEIRKNDRGYKVGDKNDTDAVIQFTKGALIKAWNSRSDNA